MVIGRGQPDFLDAADLCDYAGIQQLFESEPAALQMFVTFVERVLIEVLDLASQCELIEERQAMVEPVAIRLATQISVPQVIEDSKVLPEMLAIVTARPSPGLPDLSQALASFDAKSKEPIWSAFAGHECTEMFHKNSVQHNEIFVCNQRRTQELDAVCLQVDEVAAALEMLPTDEV